MLYEVKLIDGWKPCRYQAVLNNDVEKMMGREPRFSAKCGNANTELYLREITQDICEHCPFREYHASLQTRGMEQSDPADQQSGAGV